MPNYHTTPSHTIQYRCRALGLSVWENPWAKNIHHSTPYHTAPSHTIPYHTIHYHTSGPLCSRKSMSQKWPPYRPGRCMQGWPRKHSHSMECSREKIICRKLDMWASFVTFASCAKPTGIFHPYAKMWKYISVWPKSWNCLLRLNNYSFSLLS